MGNLTKLICTKYICTKHICNIAAACILAFLLFGGDKRCFGSTPQPQVAWYAAPCPQSPEYLEVLVDTRTLPYNSYLTDVNFAVKCRSNHHLLTDTLDFTDANIQVLGQAFVQLNSGHIYQRYIKLPFPQAKFVNATNFRCIADVRGSELMHRPVRFSSALRLPAIARKNLTASLLPPKRVRSKKKLHFAGVTVLGQESPPADDH